MLVLGRPGSGCTSLLKVISNYCRDFPEVRGQVTYGNLGPEEAAQFRQHIVMNMEGGEELFHFLVAFPISNALQRIHTFLH